MRKDPGGHTHGYPFCALDEYHRYFRREYHRFPVPPVVGIVILCEFGVVEDLFCQRQYPALDVPGCGRLVSCKLISEITLFFDKQVLVGQHHQGGIDGSVPVRMVFHAVAHDIRHLV